MQHQKIKDLKVGDSVSSTYLISDVKPGTTSKGSPFVSFKVTDVTGSLSVVMWDYGASADHELLKDGTLVHIGGLVQSYKDNKSVVASKVGAPITKDMHLYEKCTVYEVDTIFKDIKVIAATIQSRAIKEVVNALLGKEDLVEAFKVSPAATGMHHAFRGGLVEHTYEMLVTADTLLALPFYKNNLNRDLCLFGILFHDFGKIFEYSTEAGFKKKPGGVLVGHIPKMAALIYSVCTDLGIPEMLTDSLMHMVLSHHRFVKWGSPNPPAFPEALFVHYIDNLHGDVMGVIQKIQADSSDSPTVKYGFGDEGYTLLKKPFGAILKEAEEELYGTKGTGTVQEVQTAGEQEAPVDGF